MSIARVPTRSSPPSVRDGVTPPSSPRAAVHEGAVRPAADAGASVREDAVAAVRLWAVVADARTIDAEGRARVAGALAPAAVARGWLTLETCHRIELYGRGDPLDGAPQPAGARILRGADAVRHLFRVAAGLESAVVGEDQILAQLRIVTRSLRERPAADGRDPILDRLAQTALGLGRRVRRSGRPREHGLASRALGWLARASADDGFRRLLVVGAGPMGRSVAMAARRRGLEVTVATRHPRRLLDGAPVVDLAAAASIAGRVDGITVALAGPWAALGAVDPAGLPPVVDLSAPTALPARTREGLAAFVGIDELFGARTTDDGAGPDEDAPFVGRASREVALAEAHFVDWLAARPAAAVAGALVERSRRRREERVERALRRLPELDQHGREIVRQLAAQLAADLLHEPLARLGSDAEGSARAAARDLFEL